MLLGATNGLDRITVAEAGDQFELCAGCTRTIMARVGALMHSTIQSLEAWLLARELSSLGDMARHSLVLLSAETFNGHIYVTRWTCARMADNIANIMGAVFILLFLAVFATTMRQHKRVKFRLSKPLAVAPVPRLLVLRVGVVTVRTRPAIEG